VRKVDTLALDAKFRLAVLRLPNAGADASIVALDDGDEARAAGLWMGGPVDLLAIDREAIAPSSLGASIRAWTMHIAPLGYLALHGWEPSEAPSIPHVGWFCGPDMRVWVPNLHEGLLLVFQVVGAMADA